MNAEPVVGVDLVEIPRLARILDRHSDRFLERYYTASERAECGMSAPRLAARWAAKEACAKALGTGLGVVGAREIEIVSDHRGAPQLRLHGNARDRANLVGIERWSVSLSHTIDHAIAMVVALRRTEDA